MTCRCGHGRQAHRKLSGHKNFPCQAGTLDPTGRRIVATCKCRNFTPAKGAAK